MGGHYLRYLVVLIQKLTRDNHGPFFVQSEFPSRASTLAPLHRSD